ncbi:MAG: response regulator [Verrucomicrobiota bacterium]
MAKILLVDDNAELLAMAALFLRRAEHVVTTAGDGKEVMHLVEDNAFDLVITDLVMPEKEGIETIIELHRKMPALKILAISGGGSIQGKDYLAAALDFGAARTLAKPFSGIELLAAVSDLLSE